MVSFIASVNAKYSHSFLQVVRVHIVLLRMALFFFVTRFQIKSQIIIKVLKIRIKRIRFFGLIQHLGIRIH